MRAVVHAVVACALTLIGIAAPHARADDAKIVGVRVGYDGILPPERWSPLWVTIQPGDKPQSLQLTATYEQDPTQQAVMTTPVTTTPGRSIIVPLLICPPQGVARVTIDLSGGRRTSTAVFARAPRDGEQNLLPSLDAGALVVGTLGQRVPAGAIAPWKALPPNTYNNGLDRATIAPLLPTDIGDTWATLDGLNVLVARQSAFDKLPTGSLDAIARWVTGGGRLLLIADSPGDTWRRFTPRGVHLTDLRPVTTPPGFRGFLEAQSPAAASLTARPITLDAEAERHAWQETARLVDGSSLIASGPMGGGFTVIAAFDPALASAELSDAAVTPLWVNLLQRAVPDRHTGDEETASDRNYYGYMISSGDGHEGASSLVSAVDALCDVPAIPSWVYALIVTLSGVLAVAVSLGDFLILGRFKSRHRSWITAAAWITLFGLVAWALPNIVRRDATTLGRAVVVDALPTAGESAAWRSGVTAIFSATSDPAPLTQSPAASLDGFWRGVSVLSVYSYRTDRETQRSANDLPLLQRVSALDGASASVTPTPRGLPLRQWTLRTLQDFGPAPQVPAVSFGPGGDHGAFAVTGVPHGMTFRNGAVHTSRGWAALTIDPASPASKGTLRLQAAASGTDLTGWHTSPPKAGSKQQVPYYYGEGSAPFADGARYMLLDGPRRRTAAFDALAGTGEYAVVHILLDGPADITSTVAHQSRGVTLYRIAVPLSQDAPPPPATP